MGCRLGKPRYLVVAIASPEQLEGNPGQGRALDRGRGTIATATKPDVAKLCGLGGGTRVGPHSHKGTERETHEAIGFESKEASVADAFVHAPQRCPHMQAHTSGGPSCGR